MDANRNITLVGFMGTGKTAVGKRLAKKLDMIFLDMDDEIVERAEKSIPLIFSEDGEPHFRSMERALVQDLALRHGLVIGAGGGIVLNSENIADLTASGLVVCLNAAPEAILKRLEDDAGRPLLAGDNKMEKIRSLLEARKHLYAAIEHQVDTTHLTTDEVADRIIAMRPA